MKEGLLSFELGGKRFYLVEKSAFEEWLGELMAGQQKQWTAQVQQQLDDMLAKWQKTAVG